MNKNIKKFESIRNKSWELQDKMDKQRKEFNALMEKLKNDPEWEKYCAENKLCKTFDFGDMLCG